MNSSVALPVNFATGRAFRRRTGEKTTAKRGPRDGANTEVLDTWWSGVGLYGKDSEPWGLGTFHVPPRDKLNCSGFAWRWRALVCLKWRNLGIVVSGYVEWHTNARTLHGMDCTPSQIYHRSVVIPLTLPSPTRRHPDVADIPSFDDVVKGLHLVIVEQSYRFTLGYRPSLRLGYRYQSGGLDR